MPIRGKKREKLRKEPKGGVFTAFGKERVEQVPEAEKRKYSRKRS